jgi:hypothetical protein
MKFSTSSAPWRLLKVLSSSLAEKKALITIFRKGHYFLFMARSATICLCGRDWPRISKKEHAPSVRFSLSFCFKFSRHPLLEL